jgi:hypothetical protein
MSDNKIEVLKQMQERELEIIKGQHERALQRLKDQQRKELEGLAAKHKHGLLITKNRVVNLEQPATGQSTK